MIILLKRMACIIIILLLLTPETCHAEDDYIKWISFDVPLSLLEKAMKADITSQAGEYPLNWIELLAYTTAKSWGTFNDTKKLNKDIDGAISRLKAGEKMSELSSDLNLYPYFYEAYSAVLSGYLGEYEVVSTDENGNEKTEKKYGLKVFSPIARGYSYSHYDDFGDSRSFGYRRKHQGNDLLGNTGTPIVAVEDGYVEGLGWNRYGGWRIGIRTIDRKRYYYYAHLKKDKPYRENLKTGDYVKAGDVIGYLGMTGYSDKENTNNIKIPHLHFGIQIIFNEVQKDGINQIWINAYNIVELLKKNSMPVTRPSESKDFVPAKVINTIPID